MILNKVKCLQLLSTAVALSITGFSFLNYSVLKSTIPLDMLVPLLTIVIVVVCSYIWSIQLLNQHRSRPAGICLLKVNYRNTRTRCEICLKLTIKIPKQRHWRCSDIFIVNFEHISHLVLVFPLLTLNM